MNESDCLASWTGYCTSHIGCVDIHKQDLTSSNACRGAAPGSDLVATSSVIAVTSARTLTHSKHPRCEWWRQQTHQPCLLHWLCLAGHFSSTLPSHRTRWLWTCAIGHRTRAGTQRKDPWRRSHLLRISSPFPSNTNIHPLRLDPARSSYCLFLFIHAFWVLCRCENGTQVVLHVHGGGGVSGHPAAVDQWSIGFFSCMLCRVCTLA